MELEAGAHNMDDGWHLRYKLWLRYVILYSFKMKTVIRADNICERVYGMEFIMRILKEAAVEYK